MKRVTKEMVLPYLEQGKTNREIVQELKKQGFDTNANAVKMHRRNLIARGDYQGKEGFQWHLDFEQTTELLIRNLQRAKTVPELEESIRTLTSQKAALENELRVCKDTLKNSRELKQRFDLAVQQGVITPK